MKVYSQQLRLALCGISHDERIETVEPEFPRMHIDSESQSPNAFTPPGTHSPGRRLLTGDAETAPQLRFRGERMAPIARTSFPECWISLSRSKFNAKIALGLRVVCDKKVSVLAGESEAKQFITWHTRRRTTNGVRGAWERCVPV